MGALAQSAAAEIKVLLDDPVEEVRQAATNALAAVAPEALPPDAPRGDDADEAESGPTVNPPR
jgi:hypothetical protein